jgi:hypothetical protein
MLGSPETTLLADDLHADISLLFRIGLASGTPSISYGWKLPFIIENGEASQDLIINARYTDTASNPSNNRYRSPYGKCWSAIKNGYGIFSIYRPITEKAGEPDIVTILKPKFVTGHSEFGQTAHRLFQKARIDFENPGVLAVQALAGENGKLAHDSDPRFVIDSPSQSALLLQARHAIDSVLCQVG